MFQLACGDVMSGCAARFEHQDRAAMLTAVASHAVHDHGVHEITPEVLAAVEGRIAFVA